MALSAWRVHERDGWVWVDCQALSAVPGLAHAFSTRRGRVGFCDGVGFGARVPHQVRQVHGAVLQRVDARSSPLGVEADGIVASRDDAPEAPLAVRTADCVPLLVAAADGRAIAAVHAGWRGVAAGIAGEAVRALASLGAPPGSLVVALGPAIGVCCYPVGEEVVRAVSSAAGVGPEGVARGGVGERRLDLGESLRLQLEAAGVAPGSIHRAPWCTACAAELFFSHRRDGAGAGRQIAAIGWDGRRVLLDAPPDVRENPAFP